jgi:hypothetical protein
VFSISGNDYFTLIQKEANNLVDSVLDASCQYIYNNSQLPPSDSENYAIKSEISPNDYENLIKSPTIESMSGKSFDDNISVPDDHFNTVIVSTSSTKLINTDDDDDDDNDDDDDDDGKDVKKKCNNIARKNQSIERKFERISSQLLDDDLERNGDLYQNEFDLAYSSLNEDGTNLQNDFSKISWDESVSVTTTATGTGDLGNNTPDNDLQDLNQIQGETINE